MDRFNQIFTDYIKHKSLFNNQLFDELLASDTAKALDRFNGRPDS